MNTLACQPEALVFSCQGSTLVGILHHASAEPAEIAVVVIVGGPQYRVGSHRQFVSSGRALSEAGYPVLRFDYRGMGDSEGDFAGFEQVGDDIRAAVDIVMARCAPRRGVVLLGLCDAASAALLYCRADPRIAGLILINPWVRTVQGHAQVVMKRYYASRLLQAEPWQKLVRGELHVVESFRSLANNLRRAFGKRAIPDATGFIEKMRDGLEQFQGPVLLVQSRRDLTADEFRALCRNDSRWRGLMARASVQIVDLDEADHTFSRSSDLDAFNGCCRRWLDRQLRSRPGR